MKRSKHILAGLVLTTFAFAGAGQAKTGYRINGILTNAEGQKVYLIKRGQGYRVYEKTAFVDSAVVRHNAFQFSGSLREPDYYAVLYKEDWKAFILENTALSFRGDATKPLRLATVSRGKENEAFLQLLAVTERFKAPLNDAADSSMAAEKRGDAARAKAYADQNQAVNRQRLAAVARFIQRNPGRFVSLFELDDAYAALGIERSRRLFAGLRKPLQSHSVGADLRYKLFVAPELTALNKKVSSFSQADTAGRTVRLTAFKGKYLLLDFWASWCVPCRAENRRLKETYAAYRDRGFEVLGVSLDNDSTAWKKALLADELPWTNVSDLKGWKNAAARLYGIRELPTNFLIDPRGTIVDKNLRGDALRMRLEQLLGD